jgi:hypothetical protein
VVQQAFENEHSLKIVGLDPFLWLEGKSQVTDPNADQEEG